MNEINRTSAIGLARYSRDYYDAALAADDVLGIRKGYEIVAPAPVMFLVAHSIELVLKSYLRYMEFTVDELKKLSHRLDECWNVAKENGIDEHVKLTEVDLSVLSLISDLHVSTELRYIQMGFKSFPVFGPLQELAEKLLDAICPLVGYR